MPDHSPAFEAKMAPAAIRGEKTLAELAKQHDVHPNQINDWRNQLLGRAAGVFGGEPAEPPETDLRAARQDRPAGAGDRSIGQRARQGRNTERNETIRPDQNLRIKRQPERLNISRGSAYYVPRPVSDAEQALMCCINALHLERPFARARVQRALLRR